MGGVARVAVALVALAGFVWIRALWRAARELSGISGNAFRWLAAWYSLKVTMEVTGALGFAGVAAQARQPVILYLHVMLLGFVSLGLLVPLLDRLGRPIERGLWLHNLGLVVMAGGLAMLGSGALPVRGLAALQPLGYGVAAVGAVPIVLAAILWLLPGPLVARQATVVQAPAGF
jgi:hypothetical protein